MEREIIWDTRGKRATTRQTKDSVTYSFKNGSQLSNVAASEKTRGARFHAGLMEECVGIDQDILHEVIIPTMNVNRMVNGEADSNEPLNKSQAYVTTAGLTLGLLKPFELLGTLLMRQSAAKLWR